jgi:hypothetical protein
MNAYDGNAIYTGLKANFAFANQSDRVSIEFVARHTGFDEETVRELKEEMLSLEVSHEY